jgi:hypothetical protein
MCVSSLHKKAALRRQKFIFSDYIPTAIKIQVGWVSGHWAKPPALGLLPRNPTIINSETPQNDYNSIVKYRCPKTLFVSHIR